ncbi:MAG: hypothetical protein ACOYIR_06275 [Christensenellales bacterium]|jgi:hypothetical protein
MKKRNIVCILLSVIFLMAAIPSVAFADGRNVSFSIGSIGTSISFSSAQNFAKELKLRTMVLAANIQIYALIKIAQATPYDDVAWLLSMVDNVTKPVFAYAASIGATVICEYERHWIDGRWVLVDPLKVINI